MNTNTLLMILAICAGSVATKTPCVELEKALGISMDDASGVLDRIREAGPEARCTVPGIRVLLRRVVASKGTDAWDPLTAWYALRALKAIGPSAAAAAPEVWTVARTTEQVVEPRQDLANLAFETLAALGVGAVPALIDALGTTPRDISYSAADPLVMIGKPAVPALMGALNDPARREEAAGTLALIGTDAAAAVPKLLQMCDRGDFSEHDTKWGILRVAGLLARNWGRRAEGCTLRWLRDVLPNPSRVVRDGLEADYLAIPFRVLAVSGIKNAETRRYAEAIRKWPSLAEPFGKPLRDAIDAALAKRP